MGGLLGPRGDASPATPAQRRRAIRLARVAQLRAAGWSVREIADHLEHSSSTVFKDLTGLGLGAQGGLRRSELPPRDTSSGRFLAPPIDAAGVAREVTAMVESARLAFERRRHAQELAAAKAQGDRWRCELETRLAWQTARADELTERAALAEQRAAVATAQLRSIERAFEAAGRPALVAMLRARLAATA